VEQGLNYPEARAMVARELTAVIRGM
jgi:hypothetical protein